MIAKLPLGAVVVGVDGHPHSQSAVAWAARQAELERRPLMVVHATGTPSRLMVGDRRAESVQMRRIAGRRHTELGLMRAHEVAPELRVETLVRAADPEATLVELSRTARLLVVGSRGLGPVASLVRGSLSLRLGQAAACPLVVVRDSEHQPGRIVVGTDGTDASSAAVEFAFAQASLRGVPLTAVHAVEPTAPRLDDLVSPDAAAPAWLAESVAGLREKYPDVDVELRLPTSTAVIELVESSRTADLVVVGDRGHHGPAGALLGSVSQAVIERAHCSIAVVHRR